MVDNKIAAVLLIPADDDPHGLLAGGPCRGRPPCVSRCTVCGTWGTWLALCDSCLSELKMSIDDPQDALVLAWEGERSVGGQWTLIRAAVGVQKIVWLGTRIDLMLEGSRAARVAFDGLGTIVLLDADRREVTSD